MRLRGGVLEYFLDGPIRHRGQHFASALSRQQIDRLSTAAPLCMRYTLPQPGKRIRIVQQQLDQT